MHRAQRVVLGPTQPVQHAADLGSAEPQLQLCAGPFRNVCEVTVAVQTHFAGLNFEAEGQGRLLACPMDEGPSRPCDAQSEEEDIALAAWRVEQITTLQVRRLAGKWAGLRSFLPDRLPVAGFDATAPGFFWLAGQGGFGLQTSPAMALATEALVARLDWPDALEAVGVSEQSLSPERLA